MFLSRSIENVLDDHGISALILLIIFVAMIVSALPFGVGRRRSFVN